MIVRKFSRIQNLHISQTHSNKIASAVGLVEFKIYISLKQQDDYLVQTHSLVEFKIYISLKHNVYGFYAVKGLVEFKIYISLKQVDENVYLLLRFSRIQNLHISQTTHLCN